MKVKVSTGNRVVVKTESGKVSVPAYKGSYEVTPRTSTSITLETSGKRLENDVTVNAVPLYEVSNPQGGVSIYIPDGESMEIQ